MHLKDFLIAWNIWLEYSFIAFLFCSMMRNLFPFLSFGYAIIAIVMVFQIDPSKHANLHFAKEVYSNVESWKDVKLFLLVGQAFLSIQAISYLKNGIKPYLGL
jgi:hypothetical protein